MIRLQNFHRQLCVLRPDNTTAALCVCRYEGMMFAVMLESNFPTFVPPNFWTSHGLDVVCGIVEEVE
jgi:hypothetical protein